MSNSLSLRGNNPIEAEANSKLEPGDRFGSVWNVPS